MTWSLAYSTRRRAEGRRAIRSEREDGVSWRFWGGLPTSEATHVGVDPQLPAGDYELTLANVPVDAFWSISVYNAEGYFEPNPGDRYTVNSITGVPNRDGSVMVRFVSDPDDPRPDAMPTPPGWNFLVRLYRPRTEVLYDLVGARVGARGAKPPGPQPGAAP